METIKINNSVFLIPPSQPKLQANCAKEYGQFLLDCPPKLTILEAQAGGYLKGNKADFAIAISRPDRALTINENFTNEPFTELWVIPVAGGLKDQFKGPASMLLSFLIHRRSKDNFAGLYNHFAHRAFQQWCEEGMPGDPKEFCYQCDRFGTEKLHFLCGVPKSGRDAGNVLVHSVELSQSPV